MYIQCLNNVDDEALYKLIQINQRQHLNNENKGLQNNKV